MRVHELSKELGIDSKELLAFLEKKGIEVKNHMSAVSEETAQMVRKAYKTKKEAKAEPKAAAEANAPKKAAPKANAQETKPAPKPSAEESAEAPKKKKLIRVVRPQNSQQGLPSGMQGTQGRGNGRPQRPDDRRQNHNRREGNAGGGKPKAPADNLGRVRVADRRVEGGGDGLRPSERATRRREAAERAEEMKRQEIARLEEATREAAREAARKAEKEAAKEAARKAEQEAAPTKKPERPQKPEQPADNGKRREKPARPQGGDKERKPERQGRPDRPDRSERPDRQGQQNKNVTERVGKGGRIERVVRPENTAAGSKQNEQYKKRKGRKDQKPYEEEYERRGSKNRAGAFQKPVKAEVQKEEEVIKLITVPETITIQDLADKMKIQPSAIVKKLFLQGTIVTINQEIEYELAEEVAMDYEILCEPEKKIDLVEEMLKEDEDDVSKMVKRPPVVCVMGHVDHGKTSLLDAIRHTRVIDKEAGGITQHIGAYTVDINGQEITFLDTPGHEAFTSMRMRGANSTDIAILVVAADDGIMPQTVEAINHAKAAGVEIIVAINKTDKQGASIDRVKKELTEYELIPEDWGGSTVCVPVSAKTHEGIDDLLEMIVLTADVMELKADPDRTARGLVLEAKLDKGKGPVATVLVQKGTLHVGDPVAAGAAYGRVRAMMDDKGQRVKEAGPSKPVEILGLNDVPGAGDVFVGPQTERDARTFAETYISQHKVSMLSENKSKLKMSLDDLYAQIQEGNLKELAIIVKADVQGSVEAVKQSLEKLSNDEVAVKVIHGAVGAINESDITLASASNAIIIGFNVRPDPTAKDSAEREGVDIRLYRVIYNAIEDVEAAMKGMLDPEFKEQIIGHADVRQTFKASGIGTIAGSYVTDGRMERNAGVRLIRDGIVVYEGSLASLRRVKDDMKEVKAGYECGMVLENYNDIKEGDQIEAFNMVEVPR